MTTTSPLVEALLLGQLDGLSEELLFLYARTGLVHLFSASGFHMGVALQMGWALSRILGLALPKGRAKNALAFLLTLGLMLFFGIATEWSSPMVRAFSFASLLALARLFEIRPDRHWIFLLSLLAASLLGRGSLLSFLLSAFGMAGILYVRPRNILTLALAPWAATLPLVTWHFSLFSLSAPFWNLSLGLLISWTVLPLAILGLFLRALRCPASVLFQAAGAGMEGLTELLARGDAWLGGAYWIRPLPWTVAAAGLVFALVLWPKNRWGATMVAVTGLTAAALWPTPRLGALNVGQGDAILWRHAGALRLLDVGPPSNGKYPARVNGELERLGVATLDDLLLSHLDRDHIGGLASLLQRHRVHRLWIRESALQDPVASSLLAAVEAGGVPVRFLDSSAPNGTRCWLAPRKDRNESSPLCHVQIDGEESAWLTGDLGVASEAYFLRTLHPFPRANYLKVGHHGSRYSSRPEFLRATGAHTALVSAGARNRYGHPHAETLTRLRRMGMQIRRTDREGSVLVY
jgi:competence protein ComEC